MTDIKKVTVLVDNDSWILPYASSLCKELSSRMINVLLVRDQADIKVGDICFMLGCTRIVEPINLAKNQHNLVVHESDLPLGKGFAPMTWQILEGKLEIPICILEAVSEVDSGDVWLKSVIKLKGHELNSEWRKLQGDATVELCVECVDRYATINPKPQAGSSTFYPKRTEKSSELDTKKSLMEQFDLLRVVDNERYPAFFLVDDVRYNVKIEKCKN